MQPQTKFLKGFSLPHSAPNLTFRFWAERNSVFNPGAQSTSRFLKYEAKGPHFRDPDSFLMGCAWASAVLKAPEMILISVYGSLRLTGLEK